MIKGVGKLLHSKEKGHRELSNTWVLRKDAHESCPCASITNVPRSKWIK